MAASGERGTRTRPEHSMVVCMPQIVRHRILRCQTISVSAPTWIRTRGLLLRRESLYPAELSGPGRHRSSDVETNPSVRLSGVVLAWTVYLLWPLKEGQLRQFIQAPGARV